MKNPNIGLLNVTIAEENETKFASVYEKARNESSKMEKTAVAPGEKGKFQNWGEDIFLEEKCFPELFPFGTGGYLSSIAQDETENIGFAMYVKHRMLSVDSKFRNNSTYLFFLLLVKELVQLKRCKQTYLRQATKTPELSKETMQNVKLGQWCDIGVKLYFKKLKGSQK